METIYKGIEPGTEIVDQAGHAVGKVHEVICDAANQLQMVTVQRGLIFKTDVAVPAAAIDRVEGGKIHLCVQKSDLVEMLKPTLEPPPAGGRQEAGLVTPTTAGPDGGSRGGPVPQVQPGVVDPALNAGGLQTHAIHDVDTGAWTHDRGMGSAGVPGVDAGSPTLVTGEAGPVGPAESEEPTSRNRT